MWTSGNGHLAIVTMLIGKGADVNVKNNEGKTAKELAKNNDMKKLIVIEEQWQRRKHYVMFLSTLKVAVASAATSSVVVTAPPLRSSSRDPNMYTTDSVQEEVFNMPENSRHICSFL